MVDGKGCGFVLPPKRLEDHTCECGNGYVNGEGNLIEGWLVNKGFALDKNDYKRHEGCEQCTVNPWECDWRRRHLKPQVDGQGDRPPKMRRFEFFIPEKGISQAVLKGFLETNSSIDVNYWADKYFKASFSRVSKHLG